MVREAIVGFAGLLSFGVTTPQLATTPHDTRTDPWPWNPAPMVSGDSRYGRRDDRSYLDHC